MSCWQHTENAEATADYLVRLGTILIRKGKLLSAPAGDGAQPRAREAFEAHAADKPDYSTLRLLATPEEQKHPVVRAYYAALVAVPRVTGRCAVAVMGQYKTLRSLLEAYRLAGEGAPGSGRLLLQDLPVTKPSGGTQRFGARSQPPTRSASAPAPSSDCASGRAREKLRRVHCSHGDRPSDASQLLNTVAHTLAAWLRSERRTVKGRQCRCIAFRPALPSRSEVRS